MEPFIVIDDPPNPHPPTREAIEHEIDLICMIIGIPASQLLLVHTEDDLRALLQRKSAASQHSR